MAGCKQKEAEDDVVVGPSPFVLAEQTRCARRTKSPRNIRKRMAPSSKDTNQRGRQKQEENLCCDPRSYMLAGRSMLYVKTAEWVVLNKTAAEKGYGAIRNREHRLVGCCACVGLVCRGVDHETRFCPAYQPKQNGATVRVQIQAKHVRRGNNGGLR